MQRETVVNIKDNSYKVDFPNVGQFINIENLKQILSNGMYGALQSGRTVDSEFALDLIDAQAYFTYLIPDNKLVKDLKSNTFAELDLIDGIEVRNAYVNQVVPFINGWRKAIKEMTENKEEVKDK